jgi:type IV secretory pathway TraG/TraD family ATPase VirD4
MANVEKWGRKESIIWPPRGFYNTYGAIFIGLVLMGFLIYLRFQFGMKPLEHYYLPYYVRSVASIRPMAKYQLLFVSNGKQSRFASLADTEAGSTAQHDGKPIALQVSKLASQQGYDRLWREPERMYVNKPLHTFFSQQVYSGDDLWQLFSTQVYFGGIAIVLMLPFALPKDVKRRKELRYGRRLKGPNLVTAKEFNIAIQGDGIGIKTDDMDELLCIPALAENQHILVVGDTGSGKSSCIRQLAFRIQERGECAVIFDPAGEFIRQFYNEKRHDVVLNPLDERMPYWNPAEEVDDEAEALTLETSFYQPDKIPNQFFVESPQKIFAYLISREPKPTPEDLIEWMASKDKIEARLEDTEHSILVDRTAGPQRVGVLSSLNKIATTLRMLPTLKEAGNRQWNARSWCENRDGWIFLTSTVQTHEAIRPLHCVWLDMLILHLLGMRNKDQKRVWFFIDEMASLQRLPQLHTALTQNRKCENPIVLGFQGRSQLETRYGHDAEAMLSQPATKIFFRTDEPEAAKWISDNLGEIEIERLKETHYDGSRAGKNFTLERLREAMVMPSEIQGLPDLNAFLKYGNHIARFSMPFVKLDDKFDDFLPRKKRKIDPAKPPTAPTSKDKEASPETDIESSADDLGMQVS